MIFPLPDAVDLVWSSALGRQLSPCRLTRREGSVSRIQNLKSRFCSKCFTTSRISCYTFAIAGSSSRIDRRVMSRGARLGELSLHREKNFYSKRS
jgi:hypothetical protein